MTVPDTVIHGSSIMNLASFAGKMKSFKCELHWLGFVIALSLVAAAIRFWETAWKLVVSWICCSGFGFAATVADGSDDVFDLVVFITFFDVVVWGEDNGEDNDNFFLAIFAKVKIELLLLLDRTNSNVNNNNNNIIVKTLGKTLVLFFNRNYPNSVVEHIIWI